MFKKKKICIDRRVAHSPGYYQIWENAIRKSHWTITQLLFTENATKLAVVVALLHLYFLFVVSIND